MSLKKNFEYIRDWCNIKFLKKSSIRDLEEIRENAKTGANKVSNIQSDWNAAEDNPAYILNHPNMNDYMNRIDEETIAAIFNDLNDRILALSDSRLYGGGAILDLSGENNPNYTITKDEYDNNTFLLNDEVFDAIINKKIRIIIMEDRPNDSRENLEYVDPPIMFYYFGDRTVSTDVPVNCIGYKMDDSSCGWLMINKSTKIMHYENHCD